MELKITHSVIAAASTVHALPRLWKKTTRFYPTTDANLEEPQKSNIVSLS
jgi:hypothetical protein